MIWKLIAGNPYREIKKRGRERKVAMMEELSSKSPPWAVGALSRGSLGDGLGYMSQSYPAWKLGRWGIHTPAVAGHWSRPALVRWGRVSVIFSNRLALPDVPQP